MKEFVRGAVRLHVLHHAEQTPVTGAWMARELAHHGYDISPGTLYPSLHRMEADGLLVSHRVVEDGRQVRRYAVTERGIETLREGENYLRELCHELLGHDRTDGGRP